MDTDGIFIAFFPTATDKVEYLLFSPMDSLDGRSGIDGETLGMEKIIIL